MGNLALLVASAIRMGKAVKEKSIPVIKAYACKECNTMAFVTFQDNQISVKRCVCK